MACFSCSQRRAQSAPQVTPTTVTCQNTKEIIESLAVKINCIKDLHPSDQLNSVFYILVEMLQSENYCKYDLAIVYQLISQYPNVC